MIQLDGRVALVTGASRGIGAATARLLAQAGCDVAVHYRSSQEEADAVAADVERAGRRAWLLRADLGDLAAARKLAADVETHAGRLDILIHNAGTWTHGPFATMSQSTWSETMRLNLDAVFVLTQAALPLLRRSAHASIVVVTSTAGQRGEAEHAHYAASKGALISLVKSLAVELAPRIRVNSVAPGWVDTEMAQSALADAASRRAIEAAIPRGRVAAPEEIAGPIVFLASDLAAHVTGEILNVNGGSVLCG